MTVSEIPSSRFETVAELWHSLGDVPLERIVLKPTPGTATEKDLLWFVAHDKLVELIDGTLVEKPVGWLEDYIAMKIAFAVMSFVTSRKLGVVSGSQATLRMSGGNIRLPDVSFTSVADLPGGKLPADKVPALPLTLAIEVISEGNTKAEMRRKLTEYFDSGAKLVWYVYPKTKTISVFDAPIDEPRQILNEADTLDGGNVLPGFTLAIADLFKTEI